MRPGFALVIVMLAPVPGLHPQAATADTVANPSIRAVSQAFVLATRPTLVLGGLKDDPEREFRAPGSYVSAVRLRDGRLTVIDRDRVLLFSREGAFLRSIGRPGDGPGEYRYLTSICRLRGDTLTVWDDGAHRIGILTGDGEFVRHIPLDGASAGTSSCGSDGRILVLGLAQESSSPHGVVGSGHFIRSDDSPVGQPFRYDPGSMDAAARTPSVVAADDRVYIGEAERFEIREMLPNGSVRLIRTPDVPPPLSDRDYDRLLARMVPDQPRAKEMRARLKERRTAARWPAHGTLLADPTGCLWVQQRVPGLADQPRPDRWYAFNKAGRLLGFLEIPAATSGSGRTELIRIESGEAQLRDRDEDGAARLTFRRVLPLRSGMDC